MRSVGKYYRNIYIPCTMGIKYYSQLPDVVGATCIVTILCWTETWESVVQNIRPVKPKDEVDEMQNQGPFT